MRISLSNVTSYLYHKIWASFLAHKTVKQNELIRMSGYNSYQDLICFSQCGGLSHFTVVWLPVCEKRPKMLTLDRILKRMSCLQPWIPASMAFKLHIMSIWQNTAGASSNKGDQWVALLWLDNDYQYQSNPSDHWRCPRNYHGREKLLWTLFIIVVEWETASITFQSWYLQSTKSCTTWLMTWN